MKFENILILLFSWLKKKLMTDQAYTEPGKEADMLWGRSVPPQVPVSDHTYTASSRGENDDVKNRPIPIQDEISEQTMDAPLPDSSARSIQNLRNAVIWSEILAPPLALREDEQFPT
ncbi:MAG: hypothetical protein U9N60_07935 [Thermodesulfobacteriota bacterium]|nr:hypothetical protein [Thermodesulfobacteriota bacterium]